MKNDIFKEIISDDGAPMVFVFLGEFIMGTDKGEWFEGPERMVYLDAFYMDKYEVTNNRYKKFVDSTGYQTEGNWYKYYKRGTDEHPVVGVSWNDAIAYTVWADKRLPTEAEWEKAARGVDGRRYAWGNKWNPKNCCCWEGGARSAASVGSYTKDISPFGCYDMTGNVSEWVMDWSDLYFYKKMNYKNPMCLEKGEFCSTRGGNWFNAYSKEFLCTTRGCLRPSESHDKLGFRCVRSINKISNKFASYEKRR